MSGAVLKRMHFHMYTRRITKGNTGHELVIMSSPGTLSPEDYESFHSYLNHTVMNGLFPADMP